MAGLVAIGVNEDGYREVIGCAEGFIESAECWRDFLSWLKSRGLRGVLVFTGDKAAGMIGSLAEVFLKAKSQHCTVHFYRNTLAKVPKSKRSQAVAMLKAIHAMESREASAAKVEAVAADLESMKLKEPPRWCAKASPRRSRTARCRASIDGASARTTQSSASTGKCVADSEWRSRRYLDVSLLKEQSC